jgi:spore coat protein CotH
MIKLKRIKILYNKHKNPWAYIVLGILCVMLIVVVWSGKIYLSEGKMGLIRSPIGRVILEPYRSLRKMSNIFYIGYEFKNHDLPVYRLEIKPDDYKFLLNNLPEPFQANRESRLTDEYRKRVDAKFYANGIEYKVKVRYRGYVGNHWSDKKKSWDIKFADDQLFNGLTGLKLIIPEDRGIIGEYFNHYRSNKLGLYPLVSSFSVLKVNGKNHGFYFQVEPWDENYLAKHQLLDTVDMFSFYEEYNRSDRPADSFEDISIYDKKSGNEFDSYKNYAPLNYLFDALGAPSVEEFEIQIENIVDMDQFLKWQAVHMLTSSPHNLYRNIRIFVDGETGRLVFVPWDVGVLDADLKLEKNSSRLYERIFSSDKFTYERNKILWDYVKDNETLEADLEFWDEAFASIKPAIAQDHLKLYSTKWFFEKNETIRQQVIDNFYNIRNILRDSRSSISVYMQNNQPSYFDVTADSLPEIYFDTLKIYSEVGNSYKLFFDTNNNGVLDDTDQVAGISSRDETKKYHLVVSDPAIVLSADKRLDNNQINFSYYPKKYRFFIVSEVKNSEIEKVKFKVSNAVTSGSVDDRVQYINADLYSNLGDRSQSVDEFVRAHPVFVKIDEKTIRLFARSYYFTNDVVIPRDVNLIIDPGTRLLFGEGVSMVSYGSIVARGLSSLPIVFSGSSVGPWGVVAIGEGTDKSVFEYAHFIGGSDERINGVYYSGMLSAYKSDIEIKNSKFVNSQADDAVNVKHAQANISDSIFESTTADAIDFDFISIGSIINNQFNSAGNDAIDLSGSSVLIEGNFIGEAGDKGISAGEKSVGTVIYNNVFYKSNIGIEVKDLSDIVAINNVFLENRTGINAYQKKAIFGGGNIEVYNSIFHNNNVDISLDSQSKIDVYNSNIADYDENDGNFYLEPGFIDMASKNFTNSPKNGNILFIEGGNIEILEEKIGIIVNRAMVGLNK